MYIPEAKDWHLDVDKYLNPYTTSTALIIDTGSNDFKGAAAVLEFNTIESPLAQPRNTIIGHLLASLIGVSITKLFSLNPDFENLRWLAGALACGLASTVMTLTKTVYPPAGATALLAAVDPQVEQLGWFLIPLVLLSAVLTLMVSLLINNIQRQYPTYWWTPLDLNSNELAHDNEKFGDSSKASLETNSSPIEHNNGPAICITSTCLVVPEDFHLAGEERAILEILRVRMREALLRESGPDSQT
ncbi:CBS domain-containing membrane protein, partial [Lecanoromycetidae sp. Uapishka_2]